MRGVNISLKLLLRATPCAIALLVGACSPVQRHLDADKATPELVLAGGGVQDENDAVLDEMVAHLKPGESAVICPFASGDQAGSSASAGKRFESRRPGVQFEIMPDPQDDPGVVPRCVEMVDRCRMIFFTGGDQSRITARLLQSSTGEPIFAALRRARARGVVFCGTSAGTAVMSATMFTGGGSESALAGLPATDGEPEGATANAHPPLRGVRLAPGLDMLGRNDVIMDSHALRRGRYGRMIAALETTGATFAIGVADDCAAAIHRDVVRAIGRDSVLILDARPMNREGTDILNARVTILSHGDSFDLREPPASRGAFCAREERATEGLHSNDTPPSSLPGVRVPEAWGRDGLLWLSQRLRDQPSTVHTLTSDRFEVRLSADAHTQFPGSPPTSRIVNARLDIVPRSLAGASVPSTLGR